MSDNKTKLSTNRMLKAMQTNAPKKAMDFAGDQRKRVTEKLVQEQRAEAIVGQGNC